MMTNSMVSVLDRQMTLVCPDCNVLIFSARCSLALRTELTVVDLARIASTSDLIQLLLIEQNVILCPWWSEH